MNDIDFEVQKVLNGLKNEKKINEITTENMKKTFATYLLNEVGDDIKHNCGNMNISYKKKVTFKMKWNNFLNKLKSVLGWN